MNPDKQQIAIYIHIPFCEERCPYCHFYTVARRLELLDRYVVALCHEISCRHLEFATKTITSIYFGGGTPSLLSTQQVAQILDQFNYNSSCEITLEANPLDSLPNGFNRLSLGVQALNDQDLKLLGRKHQSSQIKVGGNCNLDLIFGFEGQTLDSWRQTIIRAVDLNPNHISAYSLELHDKTLFGAKAKLGRYKIGDNLLNRQMAHYASKTLKAAGYRQYEISNFAKPGFESAHNLSIWQGRDYLGFGPSAVGMVGGEIKTVKDNLFTYLNQPEYEIVSLSDKDIKIAKLLLLTRQTKFLRQLAKIDNILPKMAQFGLLNFDEEYVWYTDKGLDVVDQIQDEMCRVVNTYN